MGYKTITLNFNKWWWMVIMMICVTYMKYPFDVRLLMNFKRCGNIFGAYTPKTIVFSAIHLYQEKTKQKISFTIHRLACHSQISIMQKSRKINQIKKTFTNLHVNLKSQLCRSEEKSTKFVKLLSNLITSFYPKKEFLFGWNFTCNILRKTKNMS